MNYKKDARNSSMNFENQDILKNVKLLNADKVQGQGEMKNEKKKKPNTFNTLPIAVVQYSFLGI